MIDPLSFMLTFHDALQHLFVSNTLLRKQSGNSKTPSQISFRDTAATPLNK